MAVERRCFHYYQNGSGDERWYCLACNTGTGQVYVVYEWTTNGDFSERRIELAEFLARERSAAKEKLVELIGTLAIAAST